MPPASAEIRLPAWLAQTPLPIAPVSDATCMRLAITAARENVARRSGGPFGAAIRLDSTGEIIAVGVNLAMARFTPTAMISPVESSRIAAPNGPPERRATFSRAAVMARRMQVASETGAIGSGVWANQAGSRISADAGGISTPPGGRKWAFDQDESPLTNRIKPVDSAVTFPSREARANVTLLMDADYEWLLATH